MNNNSTAVTPSTGAAAAAVVPPPGAASAAATAAAATSAATTATANRKRPAPISTAPDELGVTVTTMTTDAEVAAIADAAAATASSMATTTTPSHGTGPPFKKLALESGGSGGIDDQQMRSASRASPATPPSTGGGSTKPYKGLRHFSMMVCKKVEEKGTTTYNEVADELVQHVISERRKEQQQDASYHGSGSASSASSKFDEKNIRRRVYDALNVLMAMDIIIKDKKAISWKGLPTTAHQDLDMLERERDYRQAQVLRKREALRELLVQQVCFRNLVAYNQRRGNSSGTSSSGQAGGTGATADAAATTAANAAATGADHKIPLPFIIVNTHSTAVIQCNMSRDLTDVMFDFSQPFEINDDNTILKRLGMDKTSRTVLQEMLPPELLAYAEQHGLLSGILIPPPETTATTTAAAAAAIAPLAAVTAVGGASADYAPAFM
jgi:E2F/DP family winged-helix DNA-binding domain/Transcription factor DP